MPLFLNPLSIELSPRHFITAVIVLLILWLLWRIGRLFRQYTRHQLIWSSGFERQVSDLNEQEARQHMRQIAQQHKHARRAKSGVIRSVHQSVYFRLKLLRYQLRKTPVEIIAIMPASLWVFENYHLLYRELKNFQAVGGSRRFSRLPRLNDGPAKGYPRVYALAKEIIAISYHLDAPLLRDLLMAYQEEQELSISELWAFQNILSLCLLEEIIRETQKILQTIKIKTKAESDLAKIMPLVLKREQDLTSILSGHLSDDLIRNPLYCVHLIHRLKTLSVDDAELLSWLNHQLGADQCPGNDWISYLVSQESRFEANSEALISALMTSLKTVSDLNWESLFSKVCKVDATLSSDPVYEKMTSESKSQYRAVIEKLSRQSQIPESQIAQEVVHLAAESSGDAKKGHVGYYLFPPGYYLLLDRLFGTGQHRRILDKLNWFVTRSAYFLFIVAALTAILFLSDHFLIRPFGAGRTAEVVLLIFLFLPACDLGIFLANFIFTRLVKPKPLPALDFTSYIPEECRTFVVMPVIINKPEQVLTYARKLEIYYLANRHKNLHFALLVDYPDAEKEIMPEDEVILKLSIEAISELNSRYIDKPSRFYLFTRPRKWNPSQNCWMGWERKRGKLEAFNAFLCGEANPGIDLIIGDEEIIKKVRYIITLDADTELLRDGAAQLIGIMAHPLNKPCIDPVKNRITEGYAIVQSEIRTRISSQSASLFAKFFSGQAGIDPYASVVSDLYQDLFSEGIYTGKGIYDLLVFHRLLGGVIPENSVLSHDLLEGSLARCAFASKVKLLDSCPASVISYAQREHRWIRGDWQLLPWIFSKSAINGLSRWKMIDNLRRSLKWPALFALLFVNILLLPDQFWLSLIFCFAEPILLIAQYLIRLIWRRILNPTARFARRVIYEQLSTLVVQPLLNFILLPYRAYLALDAIIRTIYRLLISKRNLLEWQTAEAIEMNLQNRLSDDYKRMAFSPMAGLVLLVLSWIQVRPPVLIFWLAVSFSFVLSPLFSWLISRQKRHAAKFISAAQLSELRLTARRIWRFFEEQMKNENHWLCPDCFQEYPGPKIADKTSPTNIGLQLLALLSARDLGYVSLLRMLELCDRIVLTIESLPKWNGHLFNWYNIKTLQVLNPRYVSTVDSGNFAAHFLTLKQGLISEKTAPIFKSSDLLGLNDTCLLAGWSKEDLKDEIHSEKDFEAYLTFILEQTPTPCDPAFLALARNLCREFLEEQQRFKGSGYPGNHVSLQQLAKDGNEAAEKYIRLIHSLVNSIDRIVQDINFKILYDPDVHLFHIGYNVATQTADASHYDLLASEARTASLFAIAKGDVPQKHWFRLGRPLTMVRGIPTSVSWSGSMFEYLMPNLIMKSPLGSFMQQSCRAAVLCQIRYGKKMKMPWGVSESQYYRFDTNSNYQYGPFGIPKLRLQATLRPARVIAPYATMLALYALPRKALQNISVLRKCKAEKDYGFYEALDFNHPDPERLQPFSLVRSFMAHHQGMSLVSINNLLNQNIMPKRFHEEPLIQSAEFLLEEKQSEPIVALARRGYTISADLEEFSEKSIESRIISKYNLIQPICHVLSNNHYVLMQTSDGAGYSRCDRWMVTRWNPDFIRYSAGTFIYVKNQTTQQVWSTSYLPTRVEPEEYQAIFHHDHIEYNRLDGAIQTTTRITISPHEHFEIRRVTLTNHGIQPVEIELTSYLEAVADEMMADFMHPAFSKLFLQTEYVADQNLLIAERRKRSAQDPSRYVYHLLIPEGRLTRPVQFTTDRKSFIGRGGSLAKPITISNEIPLNGQVGFSRDTIFSLRAIMRLPARGKMSVSFVTGFCSNRNDIQNISRDLHRPFQIMDLFKRALTSSELELKYLNISSHQLNAAQNLISYLYFPEAIHPEQQSALKQLKLSQSGLWRFGISGDYPLILLKVQSVSELPIIRDVLLAYEYLKLNQVDTDLVIINEEPASYAQELEHRLRELTANLKIYSRGENKPSLFILPRHFISDEEYHLLLSVSRVILDGKSGLYAHTISPRVQDKRNPKVGDQSVIPLLPGPPLPIGGKIQKPLLEDHLEYFNGFGGFANLGQEYEILPSAERITPMPWINVIANENFGFLISEIGAGYTWADNSRENKLSGWSNDPILDPASEAIYIKDKINQGITSPAALIPGQPGSYRVRHGFGYSVFSNSEMYLDQEMTVFVPENDRVRLWLLKISNRSGQERSLSVTLYVEWVLGVTRLQTAPYILSAYHEADELISARNLYNDAYRDRPAFVFCSAPLSSYTCDRKSFLGIGDSIRYPTGLTNEKLSGETGVGLDPCAVIQTDLILKPGEEKEIVFGLGQAASIEEASSVANRYRSPSSAYAALNRKKQEWLDLLLKISIKTPDRAMDLLVNGWLLYQVMSCRLLARTAFYQCGGAYGFRDQLQDVMALLPIDPQRTKKQILTCCEHQFVEGDVMHWWHPDSNLGVRTRISDDLLWLPFVTAAYVTQTGDAEILDIEAPFCKGHALAEDQAEMLLIPQIGPETGTVYQHCQRAMDKAYRLGVHGLPLIGSGDWNDGMNRVGIKGRGESVWLGWFLYSVMQKFLPLTEIKNDSLTRQQLMDRSEQLLNNIENHGWDGQWYLRAYFDDGTPLGTQAADECRIDSISQSWSVLSGGAGKIRGLTALDSARRYLVQAGDGLSLLLTPPFDKTPNDPGYIKGYYPGQRENGGQYTHAAIWLAMAFAKIGNSYEASQLLRMANPIQATESFSSATKYEKEPYVMSADVAMGSFYTGKAGWSWYTGSAGWMYQAILSSFLGIHKKDNRIFISPVVPDHFRRFVVEYRCGRSLYEITVLNDPSLGKDYQLTLDGEALSGNSFELVDDKAVHTVLYQFS